MYFLGTDDKVWRVKTDGTGGTNPGGFKTQSDVFVAADGFMYFRGTDDKVWRVKTDGTGGTNPGGFKTHSDVFVAADDGYMYFRGTDDKVWRVKTDGTGGTNPGGFKTQSDVFVAADGFMYFRGTDDKVWRVKTDGTGGTNPGGFKTQSDVLVAADSYLPQLWSGVAGTWPNVTGNANIVPVVANGEVFVASFKQLAIFDLAPRGAMTRIVTAERPLQAPAAPPLPEVSGSRFFGTFASIDGDHVVVRLRTGETLTIDLANARKAFQTVIPFVGETVDVSGTLEANGTLNAQTMLRAKGCACAGIGIDAMAASRMAGPAGSSPKPPEAGAPSARLEAADPAIQALSQHHQR
jgi:hypothetical protein